MKKITIVIGLSAVLIIGAISGFNGRVRAYGNDPALKEKSKDSDYVIKGKLDEKDKQIAKLTKKQERFENLIQS